MTSLSTVDFARWWKETGEHELRQLLFWRWDPIGVSDSFPWTADEYDGYAPQIVQLLRSGATKAAMDSMLASLEGGPMGLSPRGNRTEVVSLLLDWFEESQGHWEEAGPVRR